MDSAMDAERRYYSIGEMCEDFGVTARALRFYEDENLIAPERRGTARLYTARDRARLTWILRGKRVGFSLNEILEMLDLYDLGDQRETQRLVTIERCKQRISALKRQRADIDATVRDLEDFVAHISEPIERQEG
jgi:DNA-binding transcriptional MerR regulator